MNNTTVYEIKRNIPTYTLTPDEKNPMFDMHGRCLNPFPYTLQNGCTNEIKDEEYTIVVLENKYLLIEVLPQLGGRVQRILDKRNDRDIFYYNKVIKPQLVGTRGAWFAGGIEFNFPISHSPTSYDSVHYTINQTNDSASVTFGNIEQISSMNWQVTLTLYNDSSYMEQKVHLNNPTPVENRYYFWTNAAIQDTEDLRLVYPFDWCVNHICPYYLKWPYYEDVDYREADNIPSVYETFGKLLTDNFFGVYYKKDDYGIVHYADRKQVKGAKFFAWGKDDLGKAWNHALTENNEEYLEIQSGLYETQSVFNFIKPHESIEWSEIWYPVNSLGNITYGDKYVAMNHSIENNNLNLMFSAVKSFGDCKLTVKIDDYTINQIINFDPDEITKLNIDIPDKILSVDKLQISVRDGEEVIFLYGDRDEFLETYPSIDLFTDVRMNRSVKDIESLLNKVNNDEELTKDEMGKLYHTAYYKETRGEEDDALILYNANLKYNPSCLLTKKRLGIMYFKKEKYTQARLYLQQILSYNPVDDEARFMIAILLGRQGDLRLSRKLLFDISSPSLKKASVVEIAKINIRLGYYRETIVMLKQYKNISDPYINFLLCIAYRHNNQLKKAQEILSAVNIVSPYLLVEKNLQGYDEDGSVINSILKVKGLFLSIIREYIILDCYEEVIELLKYVHELNILHNAYMKYSSDQISSEESLDFNIIKNSQIDYCFFKDYVTANVLREYEDIDESGKISYLLGNYYYGIGDYDNAESSFLLAYEKGLRYTVLLRNLGYYYYKRKSDLVKACYYLEQDIALQSNKNEDSLILLNEIYQLKDDKQKQRELLSVWQQVDNPNRIIYPMISSLINIGEYKKALEVILKDELYNWEGKENSGYLYQQIYKELIKEASCNNDLSCLEEYIDKMVNYPANIHYGDSMRKPLSEVHYIRGKVYKLLGKMEKAKEEFNKGYKDMLRTERNNTDDSRRYSLKCLKDLKNIEKNYSNV